MNYTLEKKPNELAYWLKDGTRIVATIHNEGRQDAHLIAAAPDMYLTLELLREWMESPSEELTLTPMQLLKLGKIIIQAKKALSRAEGREE